MAEFRGKEVVSSTPIVKLVSQSVTRPNDTTTYAAGEVVDAGTGAGLTFSNCARNNGGGGIIRNARLLDSASQSLKGNFELWLFSSALGTYDNDNAVFTPTDAELATLVAIIPFVNSYVGDATSGAGGNVIHTSGAIDKPFVCNIASTSLYGVLVIRNAYIPVAQEVFTAFLDILQN